VLDGDTRSLTGRVVCQVLAESPQGHRLQAMCKFRMINLARRDCGFAVTVDVGKADKGLDAMVLRCANGVEGEVRNSSSIWLMDVRSNLEDVQGGLTGLGFVDLHGLAAWKKGVVVGLDIITVENLVLDGLSSVILCCKEEASALLLGRGPSVSFLRSSSFPTCAMNGLYTRTGFTQKETKSDRCFPDHRGTNNFSSRHYS
jgi:hypothetical protein